MSEPTNPLAGGRRWAILGTLFLAQMCAMGFTSYGYGLFIKPLSQDFGLSRADAGSGLVIIVAGMALWSPLIGRALDRRPARQVLTGGALLFAAGTQIAAWSENLWLTMIATFLLIGGGGATLGPLSGATLVARWFADRPGRVLGIIATSASAGGLFMTPALAWLVENAGWRLALSGSGAVLFSIVWLLAMLVIQDPPTSGRSTFATGSARTGSAASAGWRAILARSDFWLLVFIVGSMMSMAQAIISLLIAYGGDQGLKASEAALLISILSIASLMAKPVTGWLSDRFDLRLLQLGSVVLWALFMVIMQAQPPMWLLILACVFAGLAIGSSTLLWSAFVNMRFGTASFGLVFGMMVPLQLPFVFAGLRFTGAMFDAWQSYEPAFRGFLFYLPLVALATLPLRPGKTATVGNKRPKMEGVVK